MLSAQTKDEVTASTMKDLINDHNLSIQTILKTPELELNKWISSVGFHNKKAKYIKQTTEIIATKHNGIVPSNFEDIL